MTVMAINYNKNILGACIYKENKYIMISEIYDDNKCYELIALIIKFNPEICLVNTKLDNIRYEKLCDCDIKIRLQASSNFKKQKVFFYQNKISVGCFEALIKYNGHNEYFLELKPNFTNNNEDANLGTLNNIPIYLLTIEKFMYLNKDTIETLNLIDDKLSNKCVEFRGKTTLFNRINYTKTKFGHEKLKSWILWPLNNIGDIKDRQKKISYLKIHTKKCGEFLKKCKDFRKNIDIDLYLLKTFAVNCYEIMNILNNSENLFKLNVNKTEIEEIIEILQPLQNKIIKKGFYKFFDFLNESYALLPEYLTEIAKEMTFTIDIKFSIIYFPQIGFLVEVEEENFKKDDSDLIGLNTKKIGENNIGKLKFKMDQKYYFKNEAMEILDNEIGDILTEIKNEEFKILSELKKMIPAHTAIKLIDFIGEIDALVSLAEYSEDNLCCLPIFINEKNICVKNFFEQNVDYDIDSNLILKANTNLLVNLGQTIVLSQMGSYVPASFFKTKIFNKLFSKFTSNESFNASISAFKSDILFLSSVMSLADKDTLCLIANIGCGTNYIDGVSLFHSIHKYLCDSFVISITNYEEGCLSSNTKNCEEKNKYDESRICICEYYKKTSMDYKNFKHNILEILKLKKFPAVFIDFYKKELESLTKTKKITESTRNDKWAIEVIQESMYEQ